MMANQSNGSVMKMFKNGIMIVVLTIIVSCSTTKAVKSTNTLLLFEAVEQVTNKFQPFLNGKKVTVGLILERINKTRLKLSDVLTDELSISLRNKGIDVIVDKELADMNYQNFSAGIVGADAVVTGNFQKWKGNIRLLCQLIGTSNGKVLSGTSIMIDGNDLSDEMMTKALTVRHIRVKGTASISYQCSNEPCPPQSILVEKAIMVAKLQAMQKIQQQTGVNLQTIQQAVSGRLESDKLVSATSGKLKNMQVGDPNVIEDNVSIEIVIEIKDE
jgi:hypothetical protein